MPFIDRDLKPITEARWKALYADPGYATVRADAAGPEARVETAWVGWVSVAERPPRPFLVCVVRKGEDGWVRGDPSWHATEAQALAAHAAVLEALREPPPPRRKHNKR